LKIYLGWPKKAPAPPGDTSAPSTLRPSVLQPAGTV
jgi:hypothetical protein